MLDEGDSLVLFIYVVNLQSLNFSIWNDNFVTIIVWKTPSILEIQNVWNNSLKITLNPVLKNKIKIDEHGERKFIWNNFYAK